MKGTDLAPEGQIWICCACGKLARSRYGFDADNKSTALQRGWDESCMLNAILVYELKDAKDTYKPVTPQPDTSEA